MIQTFVKAALFLGPLPSAIFVLRAVYLHLWHRWELAVPWWLGLTAAVVCGLVLEVVGVANTHVALALFRWNGRGDVKPPAYELTLQKGEGGRWRPVLGAGQAKPGARYRAPAWLGLLTVAMYYVAALVMVVLLEVAPAVSHWAPGLFVLIAGSAVLTAALFEQHAALLRKYGMDWDWRPLPAEAPRQPAERAPEGLPPIAGPGHLAQLVASGEVPPLPELTGQWVAEHSAAGISARTGRNWIAAARKARSNGRGTHGTDVPG